VHHTLINIYHVMFEHYQKGGPYVKCTLFLHVCHFDSQRTARLHKFWERNVSKKLIHAIL